MLDCIINKVTSIKQMGKKCVRVVCGKYKVPRNLHLADIKSAHSFKIRKTPKLPRFDDNSDLLTISSEIRKNSYSSTATQYAS